MERALLKVSKRINNFEERVVTPTFYVMEWKWQVQQVTSFWW